MATKDDDLSAAEERFLRQHSGLHSDETSPEQATRFLVRLGHQERAQAFAESYSITQAAARLAVSTDRLEQMLAARVLYSRTVEGEVRLPRWEFTQDGLLPHLTEVISALPDGLHPSSVEGFIHTPSDELSGLTPIDWLAGGRDAEPVLFIARSLAWI